MAMKESITIRNFGPLKDVTIDELRPLNIFVGESGSGKSTVMKVLAAFQWLYKMVCIRSYLKSSGVRKSPFHFRVEDLLRRDGLYGYLKPNTEIRYSNGAISLFYRKGHRLQGADTIVPPQEMSLEKIAFVSDKRMAIPNIIAGMINIRHGLFYLEDTLENFMRAWDWISSTEIDYLGIRLETRKSGAGRRIMVTPLDGVTPYAIPLHEASSGIQCASAVHYIAEYFARYYDLVASVNSSVLSYLSLSDSIKDFRSDSNIGEFPNRRISIHIEEPELSLFPTNQTGMMEYLYRSFFVRQREDNIRFQFNIATHSPYIINHLNLMFKSADTGLAVNGAGVAYENANMYLVHDGVIEDMRVGNARLVNTDILSDTIEDIYDRYEGLGADTTDSNP